MTPLKSGLNQETLVRMPSINLVEWATTGDAISMINRHVSLKCGIDFATANLSKFGIYNGMDFGYGNLATHRRYAHPIKATTTIMDTPPCPTTGKKGLEISMILKRRAMSDLSMIMKL
jgi:hypothetical protein